MSPVQHPSPTSQQAIDQAIADLKANKDAWVRVSLEERLKLLDEIQRGVEEIGERWVALSTEAKGYMVGHPVEGDEWAMYAGLPRNLFMLKQVLSDILKEGRPRLPAPLTTRPNGQVVARTFPISHVEKMALPNHTCEVWLEPGVTIEEALNTQAQIYRDKNHAGCLGLILGAGNASMLTPCDITTKLFLEDQVVLVKLNPVNDYLGPLIAEAYHPLVARGFLRLVYGGANEGAYLCNHPDIETIHITGSHKTYEAIVFGPGKEGSVRKWAGKPLLTKPVTAELGGVNPVIVVPGLWTVAEIREQAQQLAFWLAINAGFNCLSPRVIITYRGWGQRQVFLDAVSAALAELPTRKAYYPNAARIHADFVRAHPQAKQFGFAAEGELPWTFIPNLDPRQPEDIAFKTEAFCSLFTETTLDALNEADFIARAVDFANTTLWGDLVAYIIVSPQAEFNARIKAALESGLTNLEYGTICINLFAGLAYMLMSAPWGAFPGHTPFDVQSGFGKVNNLFMFEKVQKAIFRAPFRKMTSATMTTPNYAASTKAIARLFGQPLFGNFLRLIATSFKK